MNLNKVIKLISSHFYKFNQYLPVVRFRSKQMSSRVDQPSGVQSNNVSEHVQTEGVKECFVPKVHWGHRWENETAQGHEDQVVLVLECDDCISIQVRHVQTLSFFFDLGMLPAQKPSNVREEKSSLGIVRIGIGFAEFVMDTVISGPFNDGVLKDTFMLI